MRFLFLCCKSFKQRKETFRGIKAAHLNVTRQVAFCEYHSASVCKTFCK